jgi:hypothetical protein
MFRAVSKPRGAKYDDARATLEDKPAPSSTVIAVFRYLLTLPGLSLSPEEAKKYSGHSLRHWLPTVARLMRLSEEDRREIARWAETVDMAARKASMPNRYSSEVESTRVLEVLATVFSRLEAAMKWALAQGGAGEPGQFQLFPTWEHLALALRESEPVAAQVALLGTPVRVSPPPTPDTVVGAEDSSSGSDTEGADE